MSRKAATALAVKDIPNLPAPGSTITRAQAVQIAKSVGAKMLRDAKAEQKAKRDELAAGVGGQITRVDETVVEQGQRFMARLALISQAKKSGTHASASPLDPIVKQMGAIVGALQAMMLTDRTIGLFEDVRDYDYEGYSTGGMTAHIEDPASTVGGKARAAARDVLAQFTIADSGAKAPRGKRGQKNVTPAEDPLDDDELEQAALEGMDEEDGAL